MVDPREFLWLVKNCRRYSTNSFHGNAFGIIFGKNLVFPDKRLFSVESVCLGTLRVDNMLQILGAKI